MTRKISVVTTFNRRGLAEYAQKMIDSYMENWPAEIKLWLYPEECNPRLKEHYHERIEMFDMNTSVPKLVEFKNKWGKVPYANGDVSRDPIRGQRKDAGKGFKWDAVRFAHKVYSIFHCAKHTDADIVMWMDADMLCHSPITYEEVCSMIPENADLCYVGRERKWPECGLYTINLRSPGGQIFLNKFEWAYENAEQGIFTMDEWHDSYVFEQVRRMTQPVCHNWAEGLVVGEGHPLINCDWGKYLDHLKGGRKRLGKSMQKDLLQPRSEAYWR